MDEDEYDEFGNYIGAGSPVGSEPEADQPSPEENVENGKESDTVPMEVDSGSSSAVVLHEDKQYYPSMIQVFGEDVETMIQDTDAQDISEPLVKPVEVKQVAVEDTELPPAAFSRQYLRELMDHPEFVRNIAITGHLHSGKTSLIDAAMIETHPNLHQYEAGKKIDGRLRYTDTLHMERERGISLKAHPVSLVLSDLQDKSWVFNMIDTPGHPNFTDEMTMGMKLADGVVIVVDVVEGLMMSTKQAIEQALMDKLPMVLVVNKIDRLILELRLPPTDAYFKIRHCIEEINLFIEDSRIFANQRSHMALVDNPQAPVIPRFSPALGNVCFASTAAEYFFTLKSFAKIYSDKLEAQNALRKPVLSEPSHSSSLDIELFQRNLWGDVYYTPGEQKFSSKPVSSASKRTFIAFVLEPLYKVYTTALTKNVSDIGVMLKTEFNNSCIMKSRKLTKFLSGLDAKPLLREVLKLVFPTVSPFVDVVVKNIPSPAEMAQSIVERSYSGFSFAENVNDSTKALLQMDKEGPLIMHVTKMYNSTDASEFYALARVYSGTVRRHHRVKILGENFTPEDEEDVIQDIITHVYIPETRYKVEVESVPAGNWVLLRGVGESIVKFATIFDAAYTGQLFPFNKAFFLNESVYKVAVEPYKPSELPKLLEGLRKVNKIYPLLELKVEESGEHVVLGTGELYMDCVLYDIRKLFSEINIKVSDPVTRFCETCIEVSSMKHFIKSLNNKNKISIVCQPLDDKVAEDLETGALKGLDALMTSASTANSNTEYISLTNDNNNRFTQRQLGKVFNKLYGWDMFSARNIWCFGPDNRGTNILQDDTLPSEVDKKLLYSVKDSIKQGFQWSVREGPLCEEPIRHARFKIMDVQLAAESIYRGGGQIIPAVRRACYSSFLLAAPRLMEPVYSVTITCPQEAVIPLTQLLEKRRGHVLSTNLVAATPIVTMEGVIPVIDSVGFEVEVRVGTQGQAMCFMTFQNWQIVPGDPLDKSTNPVPLKASFGDGLARDFVLKTRKRKGLSEEPSVAKYLDEDLIASLRESGLVD